MVSNAFIYHRQNEHYSKLNSLIPYARSPAMTDSSMGKIELRSSSFLKRENSIYLRVEHADY